MWNKHTDFCANKHSGNTLSEVCAASCAISMSYRSKLLCGKYFIFSTFVRSFYPTLLPTNVSAVLPFFPLLRWFFSITAPDRGIVCSIIIREISLCAAEPKGAILGCGHGTAMVRPRRLFEFQWAHDFAGETVMSPHIVQTTNGTLRHSAAAVCGQNHSHMQRPMAMFAGKTAISAANSCGHWPPHEVTLMGLPQRRL